MANSPLVTFRAFPEQLATAIEARRDPGEPLGNVARSHLERYFALLAQTLATVKLSEQEALLICDVLNGLLFEAHTMDLLWANIDDAVLMDHVDQKWGVDGPALVARLRALSPAQSFALVDAVERWWHRPDEEGHQERLRAVGLANGVPD